MIVVMARDTSEDDLAVVQERIEAQGLKPQVFQGLERIVVGVLGTIPPDFKDEVELLNGVIEVLMIPKPYKLADLEFRPSDTVITVAAAGDGGRTGMDNTAPVTATTNPAPAETRTSRIGTTWPLGAPFRAGSADRLYWVLAMHTGKCP